MERKVIQLQKQCSRWEEKYNNLLEKNQNDLVKIRLREKNLNETIKKLEQQKKQIKDSLELRIHQLEIQLDVEKQKKKHAVSKEKGHGSPIPIKESQNDKMNQILKLREQNHLAQQQISDLQAQLESLTLSVQQHPKNKNLLQQKQTEEQKNQSLLQKIDALEKKVIKLEAEKSSLVLQMQQAQITHHHRQEELRQKQQTVFAEVERLRELLRLTDIQYKNQLHKDQQKEETIRMKNDELNQMTQELINMQGQIQKANQFRVFKDKFAQEERRREELEQENRLLKEMIKSHKTMIKIKDNEIQNLKQKYSQ